MVGTWKINKGKYGIVKGDAACIGSSSEILSTEDKISQARIDYKNSKVNGNDLSSVVC
jgi:hypothetical protein